MINEIIVGISQALDAAHEGVTIYADSIPQDFDEPSFYIKLLNSNEERIVGQRFHRRQAFDVHYFPPNIAEPLTEIHGIVESLYEALAYVRMGEDLVRGKGMHHDVQSGVLHFFVEYDFILIRSHDPVVAMERLEFSTRL